MSIKEKVSSFYKARYSNDFILVFSPGRINLIGEHTDYNEGFVFPAAIDKGIYSAIGKSNLDTSTVHALDLEDSYTFSTKNSDTQFENGWKNYIIGVVEEIKKTGSAVPQFNMVFSGDIPVGSGLSSSAALENNLVFGLNELFGLGLTREQMIFISQKAEHNYVGVKCGIMDQYASMFGQKNRALLLDCRTITSEPFEVDLKDHELVLINTNVKHTLADSAYNDRRNVCEKVSKMLNIKALRDATTEDLLRVKSDLSKEDYQKVSYVVSENERVIKASMALKDQDIDGLGKLMYETHSGLKEQYRVSCDELDFLVDMAKKDDAIAGARMMGGGFGGCTINLIAKGHKQAFVDKISTAYREQFGKECSIYEVHIEAGTHLID
ncbi:MAG: galactokinase [Flavobacteriaceae bacterium]|nr:galactokinase [Flavobacteriaceae bacterium]